MSLAKFSVNNSALINIIMIMVFLWGIYQMVVIPKEEMPAVEFGMIYIGVVYPGVSPTEMEQFIVNKIEEEISDVDDIDFIDSEAQEGRCSIMIQFKPDADIEKGWNDLNAEMDKVKDLPEDAMDPIIMRINMREVNEMCDISLGGDFSANAIREIAENMKDGILDLRDISKVDIYGTQEREIWVEGDINKLEQYGLTLDDLSNAIRNSNMNVPGGKIDFGRVEFILRTIGEFDDTKDIEELVIRMDSNGRSLKIKDVAVVNDTLQEQDVISKLDGHKSVSLFVYQDADGNIMSVMKDVRKFVEEFKETVPGLQATIRNDSSIPVKNSINTLGTSAFLGIILVFIILMIFIGWRNAIFAALGIPFSFLLTFILMRQFDVTMNNLSLFGLVLVLGMIVDDAIVVLENVHRYMEQGLSPKEAAIKGTNEIMWPVIAAVTTTIAAFTPMLLMQGMMGKFMRIFPIVVSLALAASLFESLVILPSHIAEFSKPLKSKAKDASKLMNFLISRYQRALRFALSHRFLTISMVILAMFLSLGCVAARLVKFEFFPAQQPKTVILHLQTPVGTDLDETNRIVSSVENYIMTMEEHTDVEAIVTTVGQYIEQHDRQVATSNAEIKIDLREADEREFGYDHIKNVIRQYVSNLPGVYTYKFSTQRSGPPTGADVELRIKGDNLNRLDYISDVIKSELEKIPGVVDIEDSFKPGKKEIQLIPDLEKLGIYGLTLGQVASAVRIASYGSTVSEFRGDGLDEYDIVVRLKESQMNTIEDLKNLTLRTLSGSIVELRDIVEMKLENSLSSIKHRDGDRIITITASTSLYESNGIMAKRSPDEVTQILKGNRITGTVGVLENFSKRFPGYTMEFGGTAEEQAKSYGSLYLAFGIAILLVFAILATQFKSYIQPLIVMTTIPFAFIGVIFGLLVTRLPFSINTLVAIVALVGVVVNDSLVLVDFVNRERERGINRWQSLINGGSIRLRPIILTTITTIIGLMPMIIAPGDAGRDWRPMAVAIAFGLAFATILTLFVIPVIYSIVDSVGGSMGISRFKKRMSFKEALESGEIQLMEKKK